MSDSSWLFVGNGITFIQTSLSGRSYISVINYTTENVIKQKSVVNVSNLELEMFKQKINTKQLADVCDISESAMRNKLKKAERISK